MNHHHAHPRGTPSTTAPAPAPRAGGGGAVDFAAHARLSSLHAHMRLLPLYGAAGGSPVPLAVSSGGSHGAGASSARPVVAPMPMHTWVVSSRLWLPPSAAATATQSPRLIIIVMDAATMYVTFAAACELAAGDVAAVCGTWGLTHHPFVAHAATAAAAAGAASLPAPSDAAVALTDVIDAAKQVALRTAVDAMCHLVRTVSGGSRIPTQPTNATGMDGREPEGAAALWLYLTGRLSEVAKRHMAACAARAGTLRAAAVLPIPPTPLGLSRGISATTAPLMGALDRMRIRSSPGFPPGDTPAPHASLSTGRAFPPAAPLPTVHEDDSMGYSSGPHAGSAGGGVDAGLIGAAAHGLLARGGLLDVMPSGDSVGGRGSGGSSSDSMGLSSHTLLPTLTITSTASSASGAGPAGGGGGGGGEDVGGVWSWAVAQASAASTVPTAPVDDGGWWGSVDAQWWDDFVGQWNVRVDAGAGGTGGSGEGGAGGTVQRAGSGVPRSSPRVRLLQFFAV